MIWGENLQAIKCSIDEKIESVSFQMVVFDISKFELDTAVSLSFIVKIQIQWNGDYYLTKTILRITFSCD